MSPHQPIRPAIIVFPGSNCDGDIAYALRHGFALEPLFIWHTEQCIPEPVTHVFVPGGFSFGDYVRAGALAAQSPIMAAVKNFAQGRGAILGICNGFQILCEAGLLGGVLLKNHHDRFVCSVETVTWFGRNATQNPVTLKLPIAHAEGRFYADTDTLLKLKASGSIAMTYSHTNQDGNAVVNGSRLAIAGIRGGHNNNVLGIMPHPERAMEALFLGCDGRVVLQDFLFG